MSASSQNGTRPPVALAELWPPCGYRLLKVTAEHQLQVTDAFLRHFFSRPELLPVATSCARERALHQALLDDPGRPVAELELGVLDDPDARENYRVALAFRHLLVQQGTLDRAYLALVGGKAGQMTPPVLMNLLTQILLAHLLDRETDPFRLRAAELFFRPQKVSLEEGVLLADAEVLERRRHGPGGNTALQRLLRQAQEEAGRVQNTLEVLTRENAQRYWEQNEAFQLAFSLNPGEPGVAALGRVLEAWIGHFYHLSTRIEWIGRIEEGNWGWHIGLDLDSNQILNALYRGEPVEDKDLRRILALFKLEGADTGRLRPELAGRPVHLAIAMDREHLVRLKPQNLLLNLPIAVPG